MRVVGGCPFSFSCLDNYSVSMFNSHYSFKPYRVGGPSKLRSNPSQTPDHFFPTFQVVHFHSLFRLFSSSSYR